MNQQYYTALEELKLQELQIGDLQKVTLDTPIIIFITFNIINTIIFFTLIIITLNIIF